MAEDTHRSDTVDAGGTEEVLPSVRDYRRMPYSAQLATYKKLEINNHCFNNEYERCKIAFNKISVRVGHFRHLHTFLNIIPTPFSIQN